MPNEFMSIFAQVLVFLNSTGIIFVAYYMGKLVQRLQHAEDDIKDMREQNTAIELVKLEVKMQDMISRVERVHTNVHDLRNQMTEFMGRVVS